MSLKEELEVIGKIAEKYNLTYEISEKPILSFHFGWETEEKGLFITFKKEKRLNSTLFALPITNLKTTTYGPYYLGGTPPAADIIRATEKSLIFISQENTPPEDFLKAIASKQEDIEILPMTRGKKIGTLVDIEQSDPECVDCAVEHSKQEVIEELKKTRPDIKALGVCISGYPEKEIIKI